MTPFLWLVISLLVSMLMLELWWAYSRQHTVYNWRDSLSNLSIMLVAQFIKPMVLLWMTSVFTWLLPWQLLELPRNVWVFLLSFIASDFMYYWLHRLSHQIPILWSLHHTHHSSQWMNLTVAVRLNWLAKLLIPVFFAPLVILGLPPLFIILSLGLALLYQFFLHTTAIPRLGKLEGKLLNTPSAHRVHHGANPLYLNKNYGGFFIIWDRIFGTYQPETEVVHYGTTEGFIGYNPLRIQFMPLLKQLKR